MLFYRCLAGQLAIVLAAVGIVPSLVLGRDVEELVVHPAPIPQPALKYRLLPPLDDQVPGVAAPLYAQAFVAIQERKVDEDTWDKLQGVWGTAPLGELPKEEMRKALAALRSVLDCVDGAARRPRYGLDLAPREYVQVLSTFRPQVEAFRVMARLVMVRCRLEVLDGDFEGAVRSLQTGYAMARHCGEQPSAIHALVATSLVDIVNHQLHEVIQMPQAPNLYWAITALPERFVDLGAVHDFDSAVFRAAFPEYERAEAAGATPEEWSAILDKLVASPPSSQVARTWQDQPPADVGSPEAGKKQLQSALPKMIPVAHRILEEAAMSQPALDKMSPAELVARAIAEIDRRQWDETAQWSQIPYWQARPAVEKQSPELARLAREAGLPWEQSFAGRAILRLSALCQRDLAGLRCLEAIRLYATNHRKLPQSLQEISEVPIPVNPLTGKALPYRAEERYVILDLDGDRAANDQWWLRLAD